MEKRELLFSELEEVSGGLTCNHNLDWAGQCGGKGPDGEYYQYNAWNCKKCNILRFTKMNIETKKQVFISAAEYFAAGGSIVL